MKFIIIYISKFTIYSLCNKIFLVLLEVHICQVDNSYYNKPSAKSNHLTRCLLFSVCWFNIHFCNFRHIFIIAERFFKLNTNKSN